MSNTPRRSVTHPNLPPDHDDGFRETMSGELCAIVDRMHERYRQTGFAPPLSVSAHLPHVFRLAHALFLHHIGLLPLPPATTAEVS
jgi:hypothetical protein